MDILSNLKLQSVILNKWFKDSYMKASPGKYHLLLRATEETNTLNIEDICINSSKCKKLPCVNLIAVWLLKLILSLYAKKRVKN